MKKKTIFYQKKKKKKKNTISLPEDLIIEIQRRLPVSSMRRLCCVSKSWNSVLSNPNFVYSSLFYAGENNDGEEDNTRILISYIPNSTQRNDQDPKAARYVYNSLPCDTLLPIEDAAYREFPYVPKAEYSALMLARSYEGGLICHQYLHRVIRFYTLVYTSLFNPTTNQTMMLPTMDIHYRILTNSIGFALLDEQDDDDDDQYYHYKVVSVRRSRWVCSVGIRNFINRVHVFCSKAESSLGWKELDAGLDSQLVLSDEIPQYCWKKKKKKKKYCYWLAHKHENNNNGHTNNYNLVSFDLITEVFQVEQVLPLTCNLVYNKPPTVLYMVKEDTLVAVLNSAKED
ncbi:hypothetical protein LINPERPRIM_LOCUS39652 [Linum perenne]